MVIESKVIEGKQIVLSEQSISPFDYVGNNNLFYALVLASFGFLLILVLEKLAAVKK
jgi:putative membrane protein